MNVIGFVKEHPIPVGIGALVLILIAMRGSSSSSAQGSLVAASLQSQALASDANVKIAGINAQSAAARTAVVGDIYKAGIVAQTSLASDRTKGDASALMSMIGYLSNKDQVDAQLTLGMEQIGAQQMTAARSLDTQLQMNREDNASRLSAYAQGLLLQNKRIDNDFALANTGMNIASQLHIFDTNSASSVYAAQIASNEYLSRILKQPIVNAQAKSMDRSSKTAQVTGYASAAGDLSDTFGNWFSF